MNDAFVAELKNWKPNAGATALYNYIVRQLLRTAEEDRNKQIKQIQNELAGIETYKTRLRKMRINGELD